MREKIVTELLHELPERSAQRTPEAPALKHRADEYSYATLQAAIEKFAGGVIGLGLERQDRIAVFLPKQFETAVTLFGAAAAGCVFVPVNPVLKPAQVEHILRDCAVRVLVTSEERLTGLSEVLAQCADLKHIVLVGNTNAAAQSGANAHSSHTWDSLLSAGHPRRAHRV